MDYCATYPDNGIIYQSSYMVLSGDSYAGLNNKTKERSRAGAHIFLSENDPFPQCNVHVLTISQIMKYVVSSDAEADMIAMFLMEE